MKTADIPWFDTLDYVSNKIYGILLVNTQVPALTKDETNRYIITHFIALLFKMYTFLMKEKKCIKKVSNSTKNIMNNFNFS